MVEPERRAELEATWRRAVVEVGGALYRCDEPNAPHLDGGFVVLTSDDPDARPIGTQERQARRVELRRALDAGGARWREAVGRSPDGDHEEVGVALWGVGRAGWLELAARYGQLAVFVVDDDGAMRVEWCG